MPSAFDQQASANVPKPQAPYIEVVLVLDNTYSMSAEGKMDSLKSVANQFIDDLSKLPDAGTKISMGIVPFTNHVTPVMAGRS